MTSTSEPSQPQSENPENPPKINEDSTDLTKLQPWNSGDYPLEIFSIRFNQDQSLFSLATSRGYKIFLSKTLRPVSEHTDTIRDLGPLAVAMTYFKSPLVFFLPHKTNQSYHCNEITIFDDSEQKKISSFKIKNEENEILDFLVGRNELFVITKSQILILEILKMEVITIIENIDPNSQLISYNFYDFIAYTKLNDEINENKGKNVYVNFFNHKDHKALYKFNRTIKSCFEKIQCIGISPTGNIVAVTNITGNKIHLYYTNKSRLKECLYLSTSPNIIEKILFSIKKENYLMLLKRVSEKNIKNKKVFSIYKLNKNFVENPECYCKKYNDNGTIKDAFKDKVKKKEGGFLGFFKKEPKNTDFKDEHAKGEIKGDLRVNNGKIGEDNFIGFDGMKNKGIIVINKGGFYYKYLVNKKKEQQGNILPKVMLKWA